MPRQDFALSLTSLRDRARISATGVGRKDDVDRRIWSLEESDEPYRYIENMVPREFRKLANCLFVIERAVRRRKHLGLRHDDDGANRTSRKQRLGFEEQLRSHGIVQKKRVVGELNLNQQPIGDEINICSQKTEINWYQKVRIPTCQPR